jgi:hypothetical protein
LEKAELKGLFASGNMPAGAEYKAALGDILHTFPYFQLAQVLFAKQMYDTHEPEASGRIKLASVYAPDRKAMYHLFKKPADKIERSEISKNLGEETIKVERKGEVKYNFVYSSTTTEKIEVTPISSIQESIHTEVFVKNELEAELPVRTSERKPVQITSKKEVKAEKTEVKKPYTAPAIEKKKSLYGKKEEEKKTELPKEVVIEPIAQPKANAALEEKEKIVTDVLNTTSVEPITDNNLKYSFHSWLKVIPEISIEKKQELKQVSQKETSSIIDLFLKKAPSISRPKAEFFSPVKAAKMSITEDDAIVSETLAKIYITQGNLHRALKAYETLLLQFPEKKNIFAPRIEEIKALIRQNTKPGTK